MLSLGLLLSLELVGQESVFLNLLIEHQRDLADLILKLVIFTLHRLVLVLHLGKLGLLLKTALFG